jgi:hypothetical protein
MYSGTYVSYNYHCLGSAELISYTGCKINKNTIHCIEQCVYFVYFSHAISHALIIVFNQNINATLKQTRTKLTPYGAHTRTHTHTRAHTHTHTHTHTPIIPIIPAYCTLQYVVKVMFVVSKKSSDP